MSQRRNRSGVARLGLVVLVVARGLMFIPTASAWYYGPYKFFYWTGYDATYNCWWYNEQSACSSNYWASVGTEMQSCANDQSTALTGFENFDRIRGFWLCPAAGAGYSAAGRPADLGMGGYLQAHITFWSGPDRVETYYTQATT